MAKHGGIAGGRCVTVRVTVREPKAPANRSSCATCAPAPPDPMLAEEVLQLTQVQLLWPRGEADPGVKTLKDLAELDASRMLVDVVVAVVTPRVDVVIGVHVGPNEITALCSRSEGQHYHSLLVWLEERCRADRVLIDHASLNKQVVSHTSHGGSRVSENEVGLESSLCDHEGAMHIRSSSCSLLRLRVLDIPAEAQSGHDERQCANSTTVDGETTRARRHESILKPQNRLSYEAPQLMGGHRVNGPAPTPGGKS
jgi:hypothetical protein